MAIGCPGVRSRTARLGSKEEKVIRVLIADDFPQMIEVMERLIKGADDMTVAGVVTEFQAVLESVVDIEHEVVLMNDTCRRPRA